MLLLSSCTAPGPVFPPPDPRHRWPQPPDTPRVQYLGAISTSADLKPARRLGEAIFGASPAHGMLSPLGVCTDHGSRVFVADSNAQVVHVFDLASRGYATWRPGPKQPKFSQPVAVAWDPVGRLLVADSVEGVLFAFDRKGTCIGVLGRGVLQRPCGIAVAPDRVLVADAAAHQVVVLSARGDLVSRLGSRGTAPGEFNFPTNLALDSTGRLYVADTLNFRVQVFDADLRPIRQIGRKGDMPGTFSQPKGVALDADDHLYVVDANFEAVQVFDDAGQLLMTFGREGHGPGEFWLPSGIHVDPSGRVWVADSYNKRVQAFQYLREGQ